jgi:hypothetical protein
VTDEGTGYTVTVIDETSRLRAVSTSNLSLTRLEAPDIVEAVANSPRDPRTIVVEWIALPCEDHPQIRLGVENGKLRIALSRGPRGNVCPFVGNRFGVSLAFDGAVDATGTQLAVAED